ncbi:unnamed protein product [Adineta steineri]|uniref:GIY-YIG domain-containing protein n=1 Tax=Adineta steineri TaxID=433720 RepID=A0A815DIP7_9BILA|nr:unnamed protein product [Adineta steineri]
MFYSHENEIAETHISTVSTEMDQLTYESPTPHLLSTTQQQVKRPTYISRTLHGNNRRYRILPAFPTSFFNDKPLLLLSNVPRCKLSAEQLSQRQMGHYTLSYTIRKDKTDIPSYSISRHESFMSTLIYQYNVDEAILDYNLYRFDECYQMFINDYCRLHRCSSEQFELNSKQLKYAFEFYLQIDVDVFFMKTCSFRGAKPRSINEGLFCIDEPDIRYGLIKCNNCSLCIPSSNYIHQQSTIRYGPSQKFRFLNGYETILNCPAHCQTQNIIYVMICPCNDFEYIGETSQRLSNRLKYHRKHMNRIIHEFLIGEKNVELTRHEVKDSETLVKDRMLLYRHAARCPWAIQLFLNFNPIYACFIPVTINKAIEHCQNYALPPTLIIHDQEYPTSISMKNRNDMSATADTRADEIVRSCMRHIPPLPSGYTFSIRQRVDQFLYFKNQLDIKIKPNKFIDLFNVALIAVLPVDTVDIVRRFVESLFITHTETRLNTAGRLLHNDDDDDDDNENEYPLSIEAQIRNRGAWCRNIVLRHY